MAGPAKRANAGAVEHPVRAQGHPALVGPPITTAELAQYDFISPSDSRPFAASIRDIYESQGVEWRTRVHVIDYFPIVRRIVATTNAIGVVSLAHAASQTFQRQFEVLDHRIPFGHAQMCCAVRARWEIKPAVKAFINAVQSHPPFHPGDWSTSAITNRA